MEVRATGKYFKVQPRKVRIVADELRGKPAAHSVNVLRYHPSKGAKMLRKVLISAIANAEENHGLSSDMLRIAAIVVDEGPKQKRIQARAMGRAYRILKKTSHITVVVEDYEGEPRIKPHGTKSKARPSFAGLAKAAAKKKKSDEPAAEEIVATATPEEVTADAVAEETVNVSAEQNLAEEPDTAEGAGSTEASVASSEEAEAPAEEDSTPEAAAEEPTAETDETKGDA